MSEQEVTYTPTGSPTVAQDHYTGLSLEARRNEEQGVWQFGVNLSGAFVVIGVRKLGGVDDDIRESIDPGFKERRAALYSVEVLGVPRQ